MWNQLEEYSGRDVSGLKYPPIRWQPRGVLIASIQAHEGPVYDLDSYSPLDGGVKPQVVSVGKDGVMSVWNLIPGKRPFEGVMSVTVPSTSPAVQHPRSVSWVRHAIRGVSGVVVGTHGNAILSIDLHTRDIKVDTHRITWFTTSITSLGQVHVRGAVGRVNGIAVSDTHLASISTDKSLRLWDINER